MRVTCKRYMAVRDGCWAPRARLFRQQQRLRARALALAAVQRTDATRYPTCLHRPARAARASMAWRPRASCWRAVQVNSSRIRTGHRRGVRASGRCPCFGWLRQAARQSLAVHTEPHARQGCTGPAEPSSPWAQADAGAGLRGQRRAIRPSPARARLRLPAAGHAPARAATCLAALVAQPGPWASTGARGLRHRP